MMNELNICCRNWSFNKVKTKAEN